MIAFKDSDVTKIRSKAKDDAKYLANIEKATCDIRNKLYIQTTARATWGHYFVCPDHAVILKSDYYDPYHYKCPVDGKIFTGEPYEGAWWADILSMYFTLFRPIRSERIIFCISTESRLNCPTGRCLRIRQRAAERNHIYTIPIR